MAMNLYILFLISLPEAVLNLYIMLQLAGNKTFLDFKVKKNTLRFLLTIALMLVSSLVIRPLVTNVIVNMTLHFMVYTLIIYIVYSVNILKSLFCVSLVFMLNAAIENVYIPFVAVYLCKGYDNFMRNYHMFAIYAIPYRIVQLGIILWINKYDIVFDMIKLNKKFYKIFIVFMYMLIILGFSLANIFYTYFDKMTLKYQIIFSLSISAIVILNSVLVFNLIYIAIKGILAGGYRKYQQLEDDTEFAFSEVYDLLKDNKIESAKKLLEYHLDKKIKSTGGEKE